ncbi:aspartate carbamoyltransferase regulatory subunit [Candidatus Micrarchaeota archaeon]|nr:aspartate carbamoyltransferase regulatory subunit [Candidatus Micrarchaeota archaeon]
MQVDKIEMGTVVDHIRSGQAYRVMKILGIGEDYNHRVAVVLNVPSKAMGTKDIVKIEGKIVSPEAANALGLIAPEVTINIIKGGKVERKYPITMPKELGGMEKCPNPNCMSNEEKTAFFKLDNKKYRCYYCERLFRADELV